MSRTQLFDQLLLLSSLLQEDQERELAAIGLTTGRTHVMWLIHHHGPMMQRDIASGMNVTPRHVTTLVDELVEANLAARLPHPDDRRAVLVTLSETGTALMERMAIDHERLAADLTAGWSDTEVESLHDRIETVVDRFSNLVEAAARAREERSA